MSDAATDAPTTLHYRSCPLCEACCGLEITRKGDQVVRIRGDQNDPYSKGFICPKGSTLKQLHDDPDRLTSPKIRTEDGWVDATWDEAFAEIERRLNPVLDAHGWGDLHPRLNRLSKEGGWEEMGSLIDDEMRGDKVATRIFCDLLLNHGNPERALRRMNELGVLAAFIPEFKPIVAMMQFNMYHSYTVDEHTIQTISILAQIEREELVEELPVASAILKEGVNRKVIYVALLAHDLGKGRPEDHSVLGAQIARKMAPRLGLKPAEAEKALKAVDEIIALAKADQLPR